MYALTVQSLMFKLAVAVAATELKAVTDVEAVTEVEALTDVMVVTFDVPLTASFPSSSGFSLLWDSSHRLFFELPIWSR